MRYPTRALRLRPEARIPGGQAVALKIAERSVAGQHDELVHRGFIEEARSPLGRYLIRHWERVSLVEGESLVYWLRKLVFRGAWLDHRVKEGLLEVAWDDSSAEFGYRDPRGGRALLELLPVPSWHALQFRR